MPSDLSGLLESWALGFCPLNSIERSISDLIDAREPNGVQRTAAVVTVEDAMAMLQPGDVLIDSTGSRSLLRDHSRGSQMLARRLQAWVEGRLEGRRPRFGFSPVSRSDAGASGCGRVMNRLDPS